VGRCRAATEGQRSQSKLSPPHFRGHPVWRECSPGVIQTDLNVCAYERLRHLPMTEAVMERGREDRAALTTIFLSPRSLRAWGDVAQRQRGQSNLGPPLLALADGAVSPRTARPTAIRTRLNAQQISLARQRRNCTAQDGAFPIRRQHENRQTRGFPAESGGGGARRPLPFQELATRNRFPMIGQRFARKCRRTSCHGVFPDECPSAFPSASHGVNQRSPRACRSGPRNRPH